MNRVLLIGRVSRDPMYGVTLSRSSVMNFDVETFEKWFDKDGSEKTKRQYIHCVQYGKNADLTRDILQKGDLVSIEGSLQTTVSEDKNSMEKKYKQEIKVMTLEVLNEKTILEKYPEVI